MASVGNVDVNLLFCILQSVLRTARMMPGQRVDLILYFIMLGLLQ